MNDQMIEAVARAIERSLAFDVESDVRAAETTREEQLKIAQAAIAAVEPLIRAKVFQEIREAALERKDVVEAGQEAFDVWRGSSYPVRVRKTFDAMLDQIERTHDA